MKLKAVLITLALCFAATTVVMAKTNPHMGTWKLNEAESKIAAGSNKNLTVVYEAAGDDTKVTVDGVDGDGNATHNEWTGKFDGKCYALTGSPSGDERCYKVVNRRTMTFSEKKEGKVTVSGRLVVSANGKMRTVTTSGTDAKGKRFRSVAVYDKQ
ncbi:MAG: hypothetical protein ACRD9S_11735 [Pyrinomonadaceae bacterium]